MINLANCRSSPYSHASGMLAAAGVHCRHASSCVQRFRTTNPRPVSLPSFSRWDAIGRSALLTVMTNNPPLTESSTPAPDEPASASHDPIRVDELHSTEDDFRRRYPVFWSFTLFGPFVLTLIACAVIWINAGGEFARKLIFSTALSLWVLGRFVILAGTGDKLLDFDGSLTSGHLFLLVTWMDVMVALVLAFHIGFLFRIPFVGSRISALVIDGHFVLDAHPWMRRATFLGMALFVAFPLTATGSVGGSILGRLLGMSRSATFYGIVIGSVLGNGVMYVFSESMDRWVDKDHPLIRFGGLALILMVAVILERRYRFLKQRYQSGAK